MSQLIGNLNDFTRRGALPLSRAALPRGRCPHTSHTFLTYVNLDCMELGGREKWRGLLMQFSATVQSRTAVQLRTMCLQVRIKESRKGAQIRNLF